MLRAAIVDVGGTLWPNQLGVTPSDETVLECLARVVPSCEPVDTLSRLRAALREDDTSIEQRTHTIMAGVLAALGAECADADVRAIRSSMSVPVSAGLTLFPGADELLQQIRGLDLRCVVLSNVGVRGAAEYWSDFADLGVAHLVDAVVTSLEVGFRKPHPAMFAAAIEAAGCPPEECVMLGDSEVNDIAPAVALGMRAVRVAIEEPPPASSAAHVVVTDLPQARAIVTEWAQSGTSRRASLQI